MNALPPENFDSNQSDPTGSHNREQQVPNEQQVSWANWISKIHDEHIDLFQWLIELFRINNRLWDKKKELERAVTNPQTLFNVFYQLLKYQKTIEREKAELKDQIERSNHLREWLVNLFEIQSWEWWNQKKELEKALSNPKVLFEGFSKLQKSNSKIEQIRQNASNLNYALSQKSQEIHTLQQEIESLRRENRNVTQLQSSIERLERENQELHGRVSSLIGKLSDRDRDKTSTITSNDSRRQRDVLAQEFIQLNNQEFNSASNQIFNHRCEANPDLKANRKLEIARIKSIFSKRILKPADELSVSNNSIQLEDLPKAIEGCINLLLEDLEMPNRANCSEAILKTLENLVGKGLILVKDIINDEPPGELFIENEGTVFSSERHQPVTGCEPIGRIVYTTYPGYCINNRILGEALKAFVFTVSEEKYQELKTGGSTHTEQTAASNISIESTDENNNEVQNNENNSPVLTQDLSQAEEENQDLKSGGFTHTEQTAESNISIESTDENNNEAKHSIYRESSLVPTQDLSQPNDDIHLKMFSGRVVITIKPKLYYRNSRKWEDTSQQTVVNGQLVMFDAWAEGEIVKNEDREDKQWFRVAKTQLWLPKVYIELSEEISAK